MKHTPGPWDFIKVNMREMKPMISRDYIVQPVTNPKPDKYHEYDIAYVISDCDVESVSNAKLIAAAPELLEACYSILNVEAATKLGVLKNPVIKDLDYKYHFDKVRQAIKKATE